jgi:hypothetical protein
MANPSELNGVDYRNSHVQLSIYRAGSLDNVWFLTQDYFARFYNLRKNRQLYLIITEQVSRGRHQKYLTP